MPAEVSGNDILGYKGDPGLAYGGQGVSYNGTPGVNNLNGVDSTLKQIMAQDSEWNMMQYHQKVQDRDATLKLLAEGNDINSVLNAGGAKINFSPLEGDLPRLSTKADEIKKIILKNPDLKANPAAYGEVQKKLGEFNNMKFTSHARAIEAAKQRLEIAAENDSAELELRKKHLLGQLSDPDKVPDPYQKMLSYDANAIHPVIAPEADGTPVSYTGEDGLKHVKQTMKTDLQKFNNTSKYVPGNPYYTSANNFYKRAVTSPEIMNPQSITAINEKIDKANATEELTPDDPDYVQHIAEVSKEGKVAFNPNPGQFTRSFHVAAAYQSYDEDKLSKDAQGMAKTLAEQQRAIAATALDYAKAKIQPALTNLYNKRAELAEKQGNAVASKQNALKSKASAPVVNTYGAFNSIAQQGNFVPVSEATPTLKLPTTVVEKLKNTAGVDDSWEISPISITNQNIKAILSVPNLSSDGKVNGIIYPISMFMVKSPDGNPENNKVIGIYKDKKNEMKVVNRQEGFREFIKHESGWKLSDKTVTMENAAQSVADEMGDDIEDNIQTQVAKPVVGTKKVSANNSKNSYSPAKVKELIGNNAFTKEMAVDGKKYYQIEDNFYDADGNQILE